MCHAGHCNPITLTSGAESCTWSAEYRMECEARDVLRVPTIAERRARLGRIEMKRGKASRSALETAMLVIYRRAA